MKIFRIALNYSFYWIAAFSINQICAASETKLATLPQMICESSTDSNINMSSIAATINDETVVYQSGYINTAWSGFLKKFPVIYNRDNNVTVSDQPMWDAGEILNFVHEPVKRAIFTFNPVTRRVVSFDYDNLTEDLKNIFNRSPLSSLPDNLGAERVNYLSGSRIMEHPESNSQHQQFRVRKRILGDIINSAPVFVAGPNKNIVGPNYQPFVTQFQNRPSVVYVGANDGMLHAFSADSGQELFTYIPGSIMNGLTNLTNPKYRHEPFMDGKIQVNEAQIMGSWKTILTAGMGGGAKGIFALDVTSPAEFIRGQGVVFEFTESDDTDIGFITSSPFIAKVMTGKNSDNSIHYQYFVVVSGGYNSSNRSGDGFLFLLSLDKPAGVAWSLNKNYYKLKVGNANTMMNNVLSTPGFVFNLQGAVMYAYAGDLQGNIWRFDFSGAGNPGSVVPLKIFGAVDPENQSQPISENPVISYAPGGGYLILFGTGKYAELNDTDPKNFRGNSFYAIHDNPANKSNTALANSKNELANRTLINDSTGGINGYKISGADFNYETGMSNSKKGWYLDFPNSNVSGERSVSPALIAYGNVLFNTLTPDPGRCDNTSTNHSYMLDLLTGKSANNQSITGYSSQTGIMSPPSLTVTKTESDDSNSIGSRNNTKYYSILNFGSSSAKGESIQIETIKTKVRSGRLSWREIHNWNNFE